MVKQLDRLFPAPPPPIAKMRIVSAPTLAPSSDLNSVDSSGSLSTVDEGDEGSTATPGDDEVAHRRKPSGTVSVTLCVDCAASFVDHVPTLAPSLALTTPPPSPRRTTPLASPRHTVRDTHTTCTCGLALRATSMPVGMPLSQYPYNTNCLSRSLHSVVGQQAIQRHMETSTQPQWSALLFPPQGKAFLPPLLYHWERKQTDTMPDCRVPPLLVALARYVNPF